MTFKNLQDDALERTGLDQISTSSIARTRIKRLINQWHRRILSDPRFTRLREGVLTFSSVASQLQYGLPGAVQSLRRIRQTSTGQVLAERGLSWYRASGLTISSGTPSFYCPLGFTALRTAYSAGTTLYAASDAAGDTTQQARADMIRSGGIAQSATTSGNLNGTTKVQIGSATDVTDVVKFSISAVAVGTVSLYDGSGAGANILAQIPIGRTQSRYFSLYLVPTPSSVLAYEIDYMKAIADLSVDFDEPLLPEDYHWLLSSCARYEEFVGRKDRAIAEQIWTREILPGLSNLLSTVVDPSDALVVPDDGRGQRLGLSNLGPSYPTGIW